MVPLSFRLAATHFSNACVVKCSIMASFKFVAILVLERRSAETRRSNEIFWRLANVIKRQAFRERHFRLNFRIGATLCHRWRGLRRWPNWSIGAAFSARGNAPFPNGDEPRSVDRSRNHAQIDPCQRFFGNFDAIERIYSVKRLGQFPSFA